MIDQSVSAGLLRLHLNGALSEVATTILISRMRGDLWHEFLPRMKVVRRKTVDGFLSRLCIAYHYTHGTFPTETVLRRLIDDSDADDESQTKAHDRLDAVMQRKPEPQSLSYYLSHLESEAKATAVFAAMVDAVKMIEGGRPDEALDMCVESLAKAQVQAGQVSEIEKPITATDLLLGILDKKFSSAVIPFPYPSMNDAFGGLKKGEISIWAAKQAAGKSLITHDIAWRLAKEGREVVIVELEMRKTTPGYRQLSALSGIPISKLERGLCTKEERRTMKKLRAAIEDQVDELEALNRITYLGTRDASTVADMEATFRARKLNPEFVLVDYMTLMTPSGAHSPEDHSRIGRVLHELRSFSLQRDLHIASPMHLQASGKTQFKVLDERADVVYKLDHHEIYGPQPPNRRLGEWVGHPGIISVTATRNRTEALAKSYLEVEFSCAQVEDKPDFVEPEPEQAPREQKRKERQQR